MPYTYDTNELHTRIKLLKVKDIYNLNVLKFVYESINKKSIIQFHNIYVDHSRNHSYSTRNVNDLNPKHVKTKYGESTMNYAGCQLWNTLDNEIKESSSVHVFKRLLKIKYLNNYN